MRRIWAITLVIALTGVLVDWPVTDAHGQQAVDPDVELGEGTGFLDGRAWVDRQDAYLTYATESLNRSSPPSVAAHLERAGRDASFSFDGTSVAPSDFAAIFAKIDGHIDTSDFDMMGLTNLYWGYGDDLSPELQQAIEQRFTGFRYWYTDPLPSGIIDNKWFWSENHRLIVHTLEYLGGRALPDSQFAFTGETGAFHEQRGRAQIESWLDEKARFGFSEWHSDVYYAKDIEPLLLLTEYAEPDLARRAAAMLDLFLYDLATHQLKGNTGVTHGRSYMKDKSKATDQDVFNVSKLAFDTTSQGYTSRSNPATVSLAAAHRYRIPTVIEQIAKSPEAFVDRSRHGVDLDLDQPVSTDPALATGAPAYDDPDGIAFWWERGALTSWPLVPLTMATIDQYDLFQTELFKPYKPLIDLTGGNPETGRQLAYALRCQINVGVLSSVDTVTYRSRDAMLSSAQDYRKGCFGHQYHAWQATLDEDAVVFTTNPGNEPRGASQRWPDADLYWSGAATMPRSAQQGAAVINMYAPQYEPQGGPLATFGYLPYTHAYFPTERFDEVRQVGSWTLGRKGAGFVALYSWRPTEWRPHDPADTFTNGLTKNFDLVARGGADNVWISEVGDTTRWGSFDEFVEGVTSAPVTVTDLGDGPDGISKGFDVDYQSPTEGAMSFSWTGPLTVDDNEVALHRDQRIDNPYSQVPEGASIIAITYGPERLDLDLSTGLRRTGQGVPPTTSTTPSTQPTTSTSTSSTSTQPTPSSQSTTTPVGPVIDGPPNTAVSGAATGAPPSAPSAVPVDGTPRYTG